MGAAVMKMIVPPGWKRSTTEVFNRKRPGQPGQTEERDMIPKYMDRIEHWDFDEPDSPGGIITLHYGWSFEHGCHEGVMGFDSRSEARAAVKRAWPCSCRECRE